MMAKFILFLGMSECVLALGFEKMERGSLSGKVCHTYMIVRMRLVLMH